MHEFSWVLNRQKNGEVFCVSFFVVPCGFSLNESSLDIVYCYIYLYTYTYVPVTLFQFFCGLLTCVKRNVRGPFWKRTKKVATLNYCARTNLFPGGNLCRKLTLFSVLQEKFEWIEEPPNRSIKQGTVDEVTFACKLSHKGKKAKWYLRNQVRFLISSFTYVWYLSPKLLMYTHFYQM